MTALPKAWDYAAGICFRWHHNFLEYPPDAEDDEKIAKSLYAFCNKFCPHTEKRLKEFESRQLQRFKSLEQKIKEKFARTNESIIIHGNIEHISYGELIHAELAPDSGRITKSCIASLYACIVFTALSRLIKTLKVYLAESLSKEIEKESAWGIFVFFNYYLFKVDKRFRRNLLEWGELLKIKASHGYHAAESLGYRLTSYCKNCSDPENGRFVLMSLLDTKLDVWRCDKCGGMNRMKSKFTAKNIKKREVDIINELDDFNRYSPMFARYTDLHSQLFRKNEYLKKRILDEFDKCDDEATKATFRQRHHYFMKHYDPSKKWKIRWCSLSHDDVIKVKINDNDLKSLYNTLVVMLDDDNNRTLEEFRDVFLQCRDKLTKLGFKEDVIFQKLAQDIISSFGRDVAEVIAKKMRLLTQRYISSV